MQPPHCHPGRHQGTWIQGPHANPEASHPHWPPESGHHWCCRNRQWQDTGLPAATVGLDHLPAQDRKVTL
ncbi:hypothetical protein MRX96_023152 [Rhipicephalus microplus]